MKLFAPAAGPFLGAALIVLALFMGMGGLRHVMSQHYAAEAQRAMQAENKLPQVESNALKAIQFFPSNGFAHHLLGSVYRIQGRHQDALRHYRLALRTTAHPGATLNGMGECVLHGAPLPAREGVEFFERGLRLWPRPRPEPAYVWYEAGGLAVNNAMPAKAILFMTQSQNLLAEQEYDTALAKAEAYDNLGMTSTAAMYLLRQLVLAPQFTAASDYMLVMCRRTRQFDQGRFVMNTALAVHPQSPNLHNAATGLEFMAGDLDKAEGFAKRALELNPQLAAPHYFLGEIYSKREQWAEARPHFQTYLDRIGPADAQAASIKNRLEDIDRRMAP